jgi:TetR/AcrR family transcriptional regulator, transcriptional repressor for nem operon
MGRKRTFDERHLLDALVQVFRKHGYAATSYSQLEKETGLQAGSLYNAFGSKEELFEKALEHYIDSIVRRNLALFVEPSAGLSGIKFLFLASLIEPLGCLLTNSAIEFGGGPKSRFDSSIAHGLNLLEEGFVRHIKKEQAHGHIDATVSAEELGAELLLKFQGLLVLSRFGRDADKLRRAIEQMFAGLEARVSRTCSTPHE